MSLQFLGDAAVYFPDRQALKINALSGDAHVECHATSEALGCDPNEDAAIVVEKFEERRLDFEIAALVTHRRSLAPTPVITVTAADLALLGRPSLPERYRVIAHDRRGHGRSDQPGTGNDMDHWVADLAALTEHLDLRDAIHIGHSTGGGEVARYVARHQERVAKAALVASLTPNMYRSEDNPAGQPPEWFEAIRAGVLGNRSTSLIHMPANSLSVVFRKR